MNEAERNEARIKGMMALIVSYEKGIDWYKNKRDRNYIKRHINELQVKLHNMTHWTEVEQ